MKNWKSDFTYDPIPALLASDNKAIVFFTHRDLLDDQDSGTETLWVLPEAQRIVKKQQANGSWKYPGGKEKVRSQENYDQIETYRNLGFLVESYGFDNRSAVIEKAADFLFGFQTEQGDIRGILGNQYTPYYTAGIIELLVRAGYDKDRRVERAFKWLKSMRQNDGGWAIPLRTHNEKLDIISMRSKTLEPDRSRPFSHMVTGIVLRAYAADKKYRRSAEAIDAGKLLLSALFKKDNYTDRGSRDFWLKFTYPFWFTDLISALDTLSLLGFRKNDPQIQKGIEWLLLHQAENGLWKLKTLKNKKEYHTDSWLSLAVCRIIKRFCEQPAH